MFGCLLDRIHRALGYRAQDILAKSWYDLIHPDDNRLMKSVFIQGMVS